jgi:pyrroline-5-carboxylate reductase
MTSVRVGFIGCDETAAVLALGWGEPVLCADAQPARAVGLAARLEGATSGSYRTVARGADLVVLCHERSQLAEIAEAIAPHAEIVVSALAHTPLDVVRRAYEPRSVYRVAVNRPAAIGRGVTVLADGSPQADDDAVRALFTRLGRVIVLDDALVDTAAAVMRGSAAAVEMCSQDGNGRPALEQLDQLLGR